MQYNHLAISAGESMASHHEIDTRFKSLGTRACCTEGVVSSYAIGTCALGAGLFAIYLTDAPSATLPLLSLPNGAKELLPLGLNVVVTFLNESMGYIHTPSLRWAFQYETKLAFN